MIKRFVLAAVLLVLAGCGGPAADGRDDPWSAAGVDAPAIAERQENGRTVVVVSATTTLPLPAEKNRTGFDRRAAKIVWRHHVGRVDAIDLTTDSGSSEPYRRTWERPGLEAAFGPRPAGPDLGRAPEPGPAPSAGPFADPHPATAGDAAGIIIDVLHRTSRDHFGMAPAPLAPEDGDECYEDGLFGDRPSGTVQSGYPVEFPAGFTTADPESLLPGLAEYWASLGLRVDTGRLDDGLADLTATVPGTGGVAVTVRDSGEHPMNIHGYTVCLPPR
ncbi:hypothetical protein [Catenuloplanes indicus]|uniref:Uncharacterized protein n=1 Tax=Catenuloplanes indicus TaxID=137267 RepID=A0AAE3W8N2_9ACTN|nr:hypothetical protein [Catenuloplanes indicus]MDQ0370495.1 hypothetical protein [Catenuloplanes indicus]